MSQQKPDTTNFRDHLSTVDKDGSRVWIYPKKPAGWFYQKRIYISWLLLLVLFGLPFLKVNGEPLMLFNVIELKFILFGVVFTPQDMHLFALAMITLMVFVVLFTVVFGRLFCGWVCPQTIFMEMVFRRIEYWLEGDANQQRRLNDAPWDSDKWIKKGAKHFIFFILSILIANTFLSYIIGIDEVGKIVSEPIENHMGGFIAMLIFSFIFYYVFAFFREQVCTTVCPYGRLQGVLLVDDSVVVAYDWIRGEPRGKIKKNREAKPVDPLTDIQQKVLGDCVDCTLCVQVCPTGIDIRNGTQLECVNCTACMDACDEVMDKIGREKGLIRYDSMSGIKKGERKIFSSRVIAYSCVLLGLIAFQAFLFSSRTDLEAVILRTPGMLYQKVEEDYISNLYNYQLINKTTKEMEGLEFKLSGREGRVKVIGELKDVEVQGMSKGSFFIEIKEEYLQGRKNEVEIEIYSNGNLVDKVETNFLGPIK